MLATIDMSISIPDIFSGYTIIVYALYNNSAAEKCGSDGVSFRTDIKTYERSEQRTVPKSRSAPADFGSAAMKRIFVIREYFIKHFDHIMIWTYVHRVKGPAYLVCTVMYCQ